MAPAAGKFDVLEGEQVSSDLWHISLRPSVDVLRNGMDPLSFFRYLSKLGRVVYMHTLTDNLPAAEAFDASPANIDARTQRLSLPSGMQVALLPKSTRGQAVKDFLASRSLPEDRMFLGAPQLGRQGEDWRPQAELRLAPR